MKIKKLVNFFIVVISVLFLVACNTSTVEKRIGDGGLLSGEPCSAPCFWTMVPGETTEEQVTEILLQEGVSNSCGADSNDDRISCESSLYIYFDVDRCVESISVYPTEIVTVENVVARYGPPDMVEVHYDVTSTPEHNFFYMWLYYHEIRTIVGLPLQENWPAYVLEPNTPIYYVIYFDRASYMEAIRVSSVHFVEWNGYGSYSDPE